MSDFQIALSIVFVCSIIQSVIGIGLLVFGTPTFLLLGFDFDVAISYLLPASLGISCMQTYFDRAHIKLGKQFFIFSVPFIIIGLGFVLMGDVCYDIKLAVGIMLIVSGSMRQFSGLQKMVKYFLHNYMNLYLVILGGIHGLSNMGGGLLAVLLSNLYNTKKEIRANIAYGYIVFTVTQMIVLACFSPELFSFKTLVFPLVSVVTYFALGDFIFNKSSETLYQKLITIFTFAYGAVLLFTSQ